MLWVSCAKCGVTVAQLSLKQDMSSQHGICVPQTRGVNEKGEGPTIYVVSFPRLLQVIRCQVPGFTAVSHSAGRMREHFMFQNFQAHMAVVQEVMDPLPRCDRYGMHMSAGRFTRHRRT